MQMSAGKMLHTGNFVCTDFKKLEGTLVINFVEERLLEQENSLLKTLYETYRAFVGYCNPTHRLGRLEVHSNGIPYV